MQIRVPTNFEGREFDKSLKLLKSTPKMGQFLGHFCLQSENESRRQITENEKRKAENSSKGFKIGLGDSRLSAIHHATRNSQPATAPGDEVTDS